jgi:hypothetical protein
MEEIEKILAWGKQKDLIHISWLKELNMEEIEKILA